jgi:nitrite reductase/ring-hydroxylating ferredoxin subunit/uncharacterized membrane protein
MKSRASIKGHPIHPILVCFPVAFYTATWVFDILAVIYDPIFLYTAFTMEKAALGSAAVAAIPGIIDYTRSVPPKSSAKKRGARHALANIGVILLFGAALVYRLQTETPDSTILISLETAGVLLLFVAGWLGGTLVYRNQIGVDHRYAHAGKWKETFVDSHEEEIEVATLDELKTNQMKLVHVSGKRIVIARTEDGYAAFSDHCTHRGGTLADGSIACGKVQCPWHGSQFNVKDGSVAAGPAHMPISVYPLREKNGRLYMLLTEVQN